VNWTGTDVSDWAAAELEVIEDGKHSSEVYLLPGVTQQVWIEMQPDEAAANGVFSGAITLRSDVGWEASIPLSLTVFDLRFPQRPPMHFGGWDYAYEGVEARYSLGSADRRRDFIAQLKTKHVDAPWAHRKVLHWEDLGRDGKMKRRIDASALSHWVAEWNDARRYRVFLDVRRDIAGISISDAQFAAAVTTWAQAWQAEIQKLNKSPEQFDLLLVDEPDTASQAQLTEVWARAIRASGVPFRIWLDPAWPDPSKIPTSLIDAVDTIALNLKLAERSGSAYWSWADQIVRQGKIIEIYAHEGPARRMDPLSYYRLTMWKAALLGATAVSFWSFTDTGRNPSDNEFSAQRYNYSPLFINRGNIRSGKQMEAAAIGIQDAYYLQALRTLATTETLDSSIRLRAAKLLGFIEDLLTKAPPASRADWINSRPGTPFENYRVEVGQLLEDASVTDTMLLGL
jgi:hypothetical protein